MNGGQHVSFLSQFAPAFAALACWAVVLLLVWLVFFRLRPLHFLWLAAGYQMWCIFFGLLFITAGPDPILHRAETVIALRNTEILGAICVLIWVGMMIRSAVTLSWPKALTLLVIVMAAGFVSGCAPLRDGRWNFRDYRPICVRYIDPCERPHFGDL